MGDRDELRKGETPWKKLSKQVGGLQGEAGAEEYRSEVRGALQEGSREALQTTPVVLEERLLCASSPRL